MPDLLGRVSVPMGICVLGCFLLLLPAGRAFLPNFWSRILTLSWDSYTHQYMTERALLNVTLDTLSAFAVHRHTDTQGQTGLGREFWRAVGEVVRSNAAMDFLSSTRSDPVYHFDSERVEEARALLQQFWTQTLVSVQAKDYQGARQSLGQLLHSLQDFYSHSNWVEMGQRSIYLHLLNPGEPSVPLASVDTPTCSECFTSTCRNNLLPRLSSNHLSPLLTTGYFGTHPIKPPGKCSHGGLLDSSRHHGARGGINKDSTSPLFSPHHYLHGDAARLATAATMAVLLDLRDAVGPESFLRLLSVRQQPALVFVMDTTGSMFDEITAARFRALSIIEARRHTSERPGTFLLVPFHDPAVGPVYETEDPDQFMVYMEDLTALGGGDEPEMCLSAVLLALTHSPPLSEIFVFTDAPPKDAHMYSTVEALTLEKQSKVTFLLTEDPNQTKRGVGERRGKRSLSREKFSLYSKLSSVSGGLTVFTTNKDIQKVSAIVQDNTAASKVTLLHVESDPSSESTYSFHVDTAVKRVTLHLAGALKHSFLTSPTGRSQSLLSQSGPLAELERFAGLYRISLLPPIESGQWHFRAWADGRLTVNAIGGSSVDFLYYFAVVANGSHPGLARVEGSPVAGLPTFLVLAITGLSPDDEATFSHVTLLGANGESLLKVPLNSTSSSSSGEELVGRMASVPREPFCVRLSGRDGGGNSLERVSSEMIQPTHVQIQVLSVPRLVPGHTAVVHFDVWNHGPARHFTLLADDDHGFLSQRGPSRLSVAEKGSVRGQVEMTTPAAAEAGVSTTLTLTVRGQDSADANYAVVHLTVVKLDADTSPPSCSPMRVETSCPPLCSRSHWAVSLNVSDRGRSNLAALQLSQGQGVLTLIRDQNMGQPERESRHGGRDHGESGHEKLQLMQGQPPLNITGWGGAAVRVRYTSSCCSPQAELVVWDGAGNVRRCHLSSSQQGARQESTSAARRMEIPPFLILMSVLGPFFFFRDSRPMI